MFAPLCFPAGVTRRTLGLDGSKIYDIDLSDDLTTAHLTIRRSDRRRDETPLDFRLYNENERTTFAAGGLLPRAFRDFLGRAA